MVATVIHFYFKSMPSFGWDPERQKNETGGREKSLARGKEESELSPSVLLQEARKDWKFKRRSRRCRSDSASFCGKREACQQPPPFPGCKHKACPSPQAIAAGETLQPCQTPSHGEPVSFCQKISLQITARATAPSIAIVFPEHPWSLFPRGWLQGEHQQSCHTPISPLQSRETTALPQSSRNAINSLSAVSTSYSPGGTEQLIPLPLLHSISFSHSYIPLTLITVTEQKRRKKNDQILLHVQTHTTEAALLQDIHMKVHMGKESHALF